MLMPDRVAVEARQLIAQLCLGCGRIWERMQPPLHANGLDLIEVVVAPLRNDVPLEVFQVALDGCRDRSA